MVLGGIAIKILPQFKQMVSHQFITDSSLSATEHIGFENCQDFNVVLLFINSIYFNFHHFQEIHIGFGDQTLVIFGN